MLTLGVTVGAGLVGREPRAASQTTARGLLYQFRWANLAVGWFSVPSLSLHWQEASVVTGSHSHDRSFPMSALPVGYLLRYPLTRIRRNYVFFRG